MADFVRGNLAFVILAVMAGVWLLLRTRSTRVGDDPSLGGLVGAGRPAVLEFFSNT